MQENVVLRKTWENLEFTDKETPSLYELFFVGTVSPESIFQNTRFSQKSNDPDSQQLVRFLV